MTWLLIQNNCSTFITLQTSSSTRRRNTRQFPTNWIKLSPNLLAIKQLPKIPAPSPPPDCRDQIVLFIINNESRDSRICAHTNAIRRLLVYLSSQFNNNISQPATNRKTSSSILAWGKGGHFLKETGHFLLVPNSSKLYQSSFFRIMVIIIMVAKDCGQRQWIKNSTLLFNQYLALNITCSITLAIYTHLNWDIINIRDFQMMASINELC